MLLAIERISFRWIRDFEPLLYRAPQFNEALVEITRPWTDPEFRISGYINRLQPGLNCLRFEAQRTKDPDRWIETCPAFSKPLCEELRELVFRWEPDLTESVKTNMLTFAARKIGDAVDDLVLRGANRTAQRSLDHHAVGDLPERSHQPGILVFIHAAKQVDHLNEHEACPARVLAV